MGTPVLVLVAEDRAVLEALVVDLDRRFWVDYHLLTGSRLPVVGLAAATCWSTPPRRAHRVPRRQHPSRAEDRRRRDR
jgi:hypothetical protein